jgi:hypothetical protein
VSADSWIQQTYPINGGRVTLTMVTSEPLEPSVLAALGTLIESVEAFVARIEGEQ